VDNNVDPPGPGFVTYVLPEGAARERGTEITSRTSSQGRSLRALLYPVATAFLRRTRGEPGGT